MYTMGYDIRIGDYRLGMLDKIEIHKSVELLSDTATITLPAAQYNIALELENRIKRGNKVSVKLGYEDVGLVEEFTGYLRRISTDGGNLTLHCEDELYLFRKPLQNEVLKQVTLEDLIKKVIAGVGGNYSVQNSYSWKYEKFVISTATGYDVLKKVQEECGADIYLRDGVLHIHAPGEVVGSERIYDFHQNVESADLTYHLAEDKKVNVVVKALLPDGKVKEIEVGTTGGEKVEVRCATADEASMRARGEAEVLRRSFDGYDGNITTWLIPYCTPGDTANLYDRDYPQKDGAYFVRSVTTEFSASGGKRKIELGFRLS